MSSKHTPGPWIVGYSDGSGQETVVTEAQRESDIRGIGEVPVKSVAVVRWGCGCCKDTSELDATEKANLRLIAAAPDLLEALQLLQTVNPAQGKRYTSAWALARAAIAKATGGAK